MKKTIILTTVGLLAGLLTVGCANSEKTISICASELPHAKILKEAVAPILKEKGYDLKVTVLDWTIQNDAVASGDYDANYFQHIPYLNTYNGSVKLSPACKVHYEKLCLYASSKDDNKVLNDGESIEIVNDISNIERALQLLESYNILTIKADNYNAEGEFVNFKVDDPNSCVDWLENYKNCTLTCIQESKLCASLPDYNFGIIPGNSALTGLGDNYINQIVLSENSSKELISAKANIICVKSDNLTNEKTKIIVDACADERVKTYIASTFGSSVLYHFENLL